MSEQPDPSDTVEPSDATDTHDGPGGPLFWATAAAGAAVVLIALAKLWNGTGSPGRQSTATFLLGAGVAHDALWAPAAVALGLLTATFVPAWARIPVRLGLAFSALCVLFSWPLVRRYGARPRNPSLLPLDYGRNLLLVLALVWAVVAVSLVRTAILRRRA